MDEYGQAHYCNEYYDDDLDLVKADESSCGGDHLVSSETSTFVNAFTVCKFCNNPVQEEKDNDKLAGLACFSKIVKMRNVWSPQ